MAFPPMLLIDLEDSSRLSLCHANSLVFSHTMLAMASLEDWRILLSMLYGPEPRLVQKLVSSDKQA